ncbi:MAG: putative transporter ATP-binding protein, partial [Friedmanniella sp.]|nr:putative transporter ATP-binding protein [Friedmanniella sp.]
AAVAGTLAGRGYTVLTYTARGFGASGGRIHLDDPAYEGADAQRLIDFAATRSEVSRVGQDPVIGFAGASYGGALALMVAGLDPRVDAVAPAFTWNSLRQSLFPQYLTTSDPASLADVTPAGADGVYKQRWASLLFAGGAGRDPGAPTPDAADPTSTPGSTTDALCGRFAADLCQGYLAAAQSGRPDADLLSLLDRSGPAPLLSRVTAPTLLIQGEDDTLFGLDQADANLRGLPAGTPAKLAWVSGGHDASISVADLVPQLTAWFGRYLRRDGSPTDTAFSLVLPETVLVGNGGDTPPDVVTVPAYPVTGTGLGLRSVPLTGEEQTVLFPPGGTPTALTNLPGTGGALAAAAGVAGYALGVLPGQSATFTSAALTGPLNLTGSGRVRVEVTSSASTARFFVSVWDLGPDDNGRPSSAVLPQLSVAPVALTGLTPGRRTPAEIALPAVAHRVPVGHRLQVVLASTDQAYASPTQAAVSQVRLAPDAALQLPVLDAAPVPTSRVRVPWVLLGVVGALALAALAGLLMAGRRRRASHARPELAGVPLVVADLVKTYGDGFKAVDGVSFTAEAGQVVGLLGPNGAGKTTTMRMLVGLIRPDAGAIYVEGQPVHAGADVLGAVGAFIEGPGFLPHLTGRQNLAAFWAATGRPEEEAHLDEALAIAGLGTALERKVRGYSQGMRQRLGIAQAMLGLPALLLLDEPTNGLDPPQIRAMRAVLAAYAAAGRTVVVSSHLLSEVEHTCSHVVVMNRGRVVLTGAMADLTASDNVTLVGLSPGEDLAAAVRCLEQADLLAEVEDAVLRVTGAVPRPEIVARLVRAGFDVESVDGRRQLEEVFMSLVGAPAGGPEVSDD